MRTTRRATLAALAGPLVIPKTAGAMPSDSDTLPALLIERRRAISLMNDDNRHVTDAEEVRLMGTIAACDAVATTSHATTEAGAIASIEWVRDELLQFGFDANEPDNGTRLVLALLDGAVGVLRQVGRTA